MHSSASGELTVGDSSNDWTRRSLAQLNINKTIIVMFNISQYNNVQQRTTTNNNVQQLLTVYHKPQLLHDKTDILNDQ